MVEWVKELFRIATMGCDVVNVCCWHAIKPVLAEWIRAEWVVT
jgi:hypothetical protein